MQPLNYLQSTTGIIWTCVCIVMGFLLTMLAYFIINKVPAKWLCDYNEVPSPELLSGKRVSYKKSGIILSFVTAVCLVLCRIQFNKGYDVYFILFALIIFTSLMIAVSDMKYTIIPDQFTIMLGVLGLAVSIYDLVRGFNILHQSWWSPLAGAAIGAGVMLLIDFLGMIIYKKDGMGFGDVKLFFAIGILTGFPGTIYTLIISIIVAALCFTIILVVAKIVFSRKDDSTAEQISENKENTEELSTKFDEDVEKSSETDDDSEQVSGSSQLAFGPYIAIAVIAYISLFDYINYLVSLYLNLF